MPITIGSNIASLMAQRRLADSSSQLSKTYERLSSGIRINAASDDAAGLSIAESLKADRRVFSQGIRNFNDGISLLNVADSAIESLSGIVVRLKELAEQAANGTYSHQQRKAIDAEAQALSKEFTRIAQSTKFNDTNLLNGSLNELRLQGGYGLNGAISQTLGGGIGDGTFGSLTTYLHASGTEAPTDVKLVDINGDGKLDMAYTGSNFGPTNGFVGIRLGDGNGNFGAATTYAAETLTTSKVTLADINNDGMLDLLSAGIATGNDGYATVRLGRGDGTFGSATSYAQESRATGAIHASDMNGDGILDMVTSGQTDGFQSMVSVRLGVGDGTFGAITSYVHTGNGNAGTQIGDFNGDGILDVVSIDTVSAGSDAYINVRLGVGNGTLGAAVSYTAETGGGRSITIGDLNGDGKIDVITSGLSDSGDGYFGVRLGNGDGTFGAYSSYAGESNSSRAVTLGDINGDGKLDVVTAGYTDGGTAYMTMHLGLGDGTFRSSGTYDMGASTYAAAVALADVNNDGVLDVVGGSRFSGPALGIVTRLGTAKSGVSALTAFSLLSSGDAKLALTQFTKKLDQLTSQRGQIGAFQARIQVGINNLQSASENYAAAESRIRDADIAQESANLVRLKILQQAASSILGQANLQPQLALTLLKGGA